MVSNSGLIIEAFDIVVTSLNGRDYWVENIIRLDPLKLGEWIGYYDLIVIYLRDFEMIIGMDFLNQAEVIMLLTYKP